MDAAWLAAGAVDQEGRDVSHLIVRDDGLYYVQAETGEEAYLTFRYGQEVNL